MGYNTTVFILNDQLSSIEKDPERFVTDIVSGMNGGDDHALGQTVVMQTQHADVPRLYFTKGNSIIELSEYARRTQQYYTASAYGKEWIDSTIREAKRMIKDLGKAKEGWT